MSTNLHSAAWLGLTDEDISRITDSGTTASVLADISLIIRVVVDTFEGNERKARRWFDVENPLLGGVAPREIIQVGRTSLLKRAVASFLAEQGRSLPVQDDTQGQAGVELEP